jgi:hypothetical protein
MGRWWRDACSSRQTRYALCKVSTCVPLVLSSFALSFISYLSALLPALASPAPNAVALTTSTAPALPTPFHIHTHTHSPFSPLRLRIPVGIMNLPRNLDHPKLTPPADFPFLLHSRCRRRVRKHTPTTWIPLLDFDHRLHACSILQDRSGYYNHHWQHENDTASHRPSSTHAAPTAVRSSTSSLKVVFYSQSHLLVLREDGSSWLRMCLANTSLLSCSVPPLLDNRSPAPEVAFETIAGMLAVWYAQAQ